MSARKGAAAIAALTLLGVLLMGAGPGSPRKAEPAPKVNLQPRSTAHASGETRCGMCHTPAGWSPAAFAHEKTGFPLKGAHQRADCKACHTAGFDSPLPASCGSCHRDAHRGDFGQRCEGCHDEASWKARFTADAHRRTAFPLVGRHALIPCNECHFEARDRRFSRNAVDCVGCHQQDYDRTALTTLDHAALGFSTTCRDCHNPWRFTGAATFPGHDACFRISSGHHAGMECRSCHTTLAGATLSGLCATNTAACTACHEHSCARTDGEHRDVAGYQCKDRKCYECHRYSTGN